MRTTIYILFLSSLLFSCTQDHQKNEQEVTTDLIQNPASLGTDSSGEKKLPVIAFEKLEHDFGKVKEGDKVTYDFTFTNNGNAPLLISDVQASCGCTTPEWPRKLIKPGESNNIVVEFDSKGRVGEFGKTVVVTANTYPNNTTLRISGVVFKE